MVRETLSRARSRVRGFQTAAYSRIAAPIEGLHQAAYVLALLTLASQMLSLLRDRTFAHTFGAGQVLDLYYAAFRVPDLVFAIVSSLVSAYVIIPRIAQADPASVRKLLSETATFLVAAGGVVCLGLAFFMPELLTALFPDLMQDALHADFVLLARLLLIQPILLGLSGIVSSVTQVHRRFVLFALSPVLYNLGIIAGTIYGYPLFGLPGIGLGVVVGAVAYLLVQVPVLVQSQVVPRVMVPRWRDMLPIVRDSVPRSLALGMNSITALALTAVASRMSSGAVSVFTFATNLAAVPLALIGSSYAVAAFPALSAASDDRKEFTAILSASARHILVWSLVAFGLIVALRAHVVRVILGTGAFDWGATRLTAALLVVLAFGLAADALELLFNRALYAARQSWRPFLYQLVAGGLTVVVAVALLSLPVAPLLTPLAGFLRVGDLADTAILLVALASSLGQLFLIVLSLVALRTVAPGLSRSLVRPFFEGAAAALAAAVVAHAVLVALGDIEPGSTLLKVLLQGGVGGLLGGVAAAGVLYVVDNKEFGIVAEALLRLKRSKNPHTEVLVPAGEEPRTL